MNRLVGKVAVITGGASGIGEAAVRLFVEEGCKVVIADRQNEKGEELARSLGEAAVYAHTDVSSEDDVKAAVETAVSAFGRLDCIFNNAGSARTSSRWKTWRWPTTSASWRSTSAASFSA